MSEFTPSSYQEEIFKFIETGVGNAVINAKAGSGKTTTLEKAMAYIPENEKVLFIAFNKAICEELTKRLKRSNCKNVDVRTFHSLGYAILMENMGYIKPQDWKYTRHISNNIRKYTATNAKTLGSLRKFKTYKNNIKELVNFARFNFAQSTEEIAKLADRYGIALLADECDVTAKILEWGADNLDEIDYTDMIWLCSELQLETMKYKYDKIFIDEAQDASVINQMLFEKCLKRGGRFVAVGDRDQCINAFAGADSEAFDKFLAKPNTIKLDLPISYRCPKVIVKEVNAKGIDIKHRDNAPEGSINFDAHPYAPVSGDMVLCRTTAPLTRLFSEYMKINKKAYIKGKDIGDKLIDKIDTTGEDYLSLNMRSDGVFPRLYEMMFNTLDEVMKREKIELEDAVMDEKFNQMYDSIIALESLAQGLTRAEELISKIKTIFTNDNAEGVCLSTIHKAKGLEADNVYVLCPSLLPSKCAKEEWEKRQEANLEYVMMTRAKLNLHYISEDLFSPDAFQGDFFAELDSMRAKMNKALNVKTEFFKPESGVTYCADMSDDVKRVLGLMEMPKRTVNENRKKKVGGNKFNFTKHK